HRRPRAAHGSPRRAESYGATVTPRSRGPLRRSTAASRRRRRPLTVLRAPRVPNRRGTVSARRLNGMSLARRTEMSVNNVQGLAIAIALLVVGRALVAVFQYLFGVGQ